MFKTWIPMNMSGRNKLNARLTTDSLSVSLELESRVRSEVAERTQIEYDMNLQHHGYVSSIIHEKHE